MVPPPPPAAPRRAQALARTIRRLDRLHGRGTRISSLYSRWRLVIFLVGVAVTVTLFHGTWYQAGNASLVLFLGIFLIVARYHSRLEDRLQRLRRWREIKQIHAGRLALDWSVIPVRHMEAVEAHPYAADLDVVGPRSLLHLIDTTNSLNGRHRLAAWLLQQPPTADRWRDRQAAVRELARLSLFRDRLGLEASLVGDVELDGRRIESALSAPVAFPLLVPLLLLQGTLAATTLTLILASAMGVLADYWILSFALYAAVYLLHSSQIEPIFGRALSLHGELEKLRALFTYLETRSYAPTPSLGRLCAPLTAQGARPSRALRRLARVTHGLSIRAHPLAHLAVNALGPWDLYFTWRLDRERSRIVERIPNWLETISELEAANALATFADLHPEYQWPTLSGETVGAPPGETSELKAVALGHPLIAPDRRVTNDVTLEGLGRILLVTGSNMSGKSTFLRTVGVNTCLAQAGAPVCAASFIWTWVRIGCCIRIDDSLAAGLSYFYAEVKRLKQVLVAVHDWQAPPVLFLIDEIFKGTNNRERLTGSRAYIQALAEGNGFGLVTTHDLELAELEKTIPSLTNAHFQESVHGNELTFDYRLRPGPCPTTNALRIMAIEGLPVDDGEADASRRISRGRGD